MSLRIAAERARFAQSFYRFTCAAWLVLRGKFTNSWHIEELCDHLQAVAERRIKRLAIALPPGLSKSTITCVLWPAWWWITEPWHRWMFVSVDPALVKRDARDSRALIESDWYQARWGDKYTIAADKYHADGSQEFYTQSDAHPDGLRFSTSLKSKGVGWHVHTQVGDDLIKPDDGLGGCMHARRTWEKTYSSRIAEPASHFCRVLQQQRLGPADMIGYAIDHGYEQVIFPMHADPARYALSEEDPRALRRSSLWNSRTGRGGDRRTEQGALLCPERKPAALVRKEREERGSAYGPQEEQDPTQSKDRPFPRERLTARWRVLPPGGTYAYDWDFASKGEEQRVTERGSFTVGWKWYETASASYLVEEFRGEGDFEWQIALIKKAFKNRAGKMYFEDKSNGPAAQSLLKSEIPGIEMVPVCRSKLERAIAVKGFLDRVYWPYTPWMDAVFAELGRHPSKPDDRGDVLSQHLARRWLPGENAKIEAERKYESGLAALGRTGRQRRY